MRIDKGDIIGGHRVIELAGCGGMGTVYKTEHLITRRIEAMKVLPLSVGIGPEEILRFEREIQVQARLQHPNVATLYSAVREENAIALTMEYVEGESLERLLERQRLPLDVAARYARHILDALAYAHRNSVIHCDVSPANILITPEGSAKLTDFGLARAATDLGVATAGVAMGSPWHMAPEQVRGTEPLDARADLYAMGTVLYEMLTGRKLFEVEGAFAIMRAHLDTTPQPPSTHRKEIPAALNAVVCKALAKDPAARFQTAEEFLHALDGALAGRHGAVLRPVLIATGIATIACAAVWQTRPSRAAEPSLAEIALPEAPMPNIPSAPLPPPRAATPAPETTAVTPPPRPAPATRRAIPVEPLERIEPRAALQTAAADAALPEAPPPDEPIRLETPPPMPVEVQPPAIEAPRAPKTGNRFVRALGKLNPFRKDAKDTDPPKR